MRFSAQLLVACLATAAAPSWAFIADTTWPVRFGMDRISSPARTQLHLYSGASLVNNRHSASDWLYNIQSLPHSEVLREVKSPVIAVAAFSSVVSLVHQLVGNAICIPGTAHGFLVSALGLLLVFRTNSAYQRFNVSPGLCLRHKRDGLLWIAEQALIQPVTSLSIYTGRT